MSDTDRQFIWSLERRESAEDILRKVEAALDSMKVCGGMPTNAEFRKGLAYGASLFMGILAITITESEIDETIESIVGDLFAGAAHVLESAAK